MNRITSLLSALSVATLLLWSPGARAGALGKPTKLDTPTNVTCTKAGDTLTVTWDVVPNAGQYRVHLDADEDQGMVENVPQPPYTQALSEMTDDPTAPVTAKVRAMQTKSGRGASKPSADAKCTEGSPGTPAQLPSR